MDTSLLRDALFGVHTKTRNELEPSKTSWNYLEHAETTWNELK